MELSKQEQKILDKAKRTLRRDEWARRHKTLRICCHVWGVVFLCVYVLALWGLFGETARRVCVVLVGIGFVGRSLEGYRATHTRSLIRKLWESSQGKRASESDGS